VELRVHAMNYESAAFLIVLVQLCTLIISVSVKAFVAMTNNFLFLFYNTNLLIIGAFVVCREKGLIKQ